MSRPPRVALDTAVVLRALLNSDAGSKRLRLGWQSGQFQALIGRSTAQALMASLAYPAFQLDAEQQQELLADFLPFAEVVAERPGMPAATPPLLALLDAPAASLDWAVSDCARLRSTLSRKKGLACGLLGADEFVDRLC